MHFPTYLLLSFTFLHSANIFADTANCKTYAAQTNKEKQQLLIYCEQELISDHPLFPEFNELMTFRNKNKQELTEKDYNQPELKWCQLGDNERIATLQKKRTEAIILCKKAFRKLYGHTAKTVTDLTPKNYQILQRKDAEPIHYDFNHDGIKDSIFILLKASGSTTGRLFIALSQPNGNFKSLPIAPYHIGNHDKESGNPYSTITLQQPNRFILTTQSLENNHWDSREEWVFQYKNNDFNLISYSTGYTSINYDDASKSIYKSSVYQFDKKTVYNNKKERCDYYHPKPPHYKCNTKKLAFTTDALIKIENFTDTDKLSK